MKIYFLFFVMVCIYATYGYAESRESHDEDAHVIQAEDGNLSTGMDDEKEEDHEDEKEKSHTKKHKKHKKHGLDGLFSELQDVTESVEGLSEGGNLKDLIGSISGHKSDDEDDAENEDEENDPESGDEENDGSDAHEHEEDHPKKDKGFGNIADTLGKLFG